MHSEQKKLPPLGIQWTIGDASPAGFQGLQLSIRGMWRMFGKHAQYAGCVNTIPVRVATERTGEIPSEVRWIDAAQLVPDWLWDYVSAEMAEGVAWKLASPVRSREDRSN